MARKEVRSPQVLGMKTCGGADREQHYRNWVIWRCPSVRFFDYRKVKDAEREKAKELFGTTSKPSALASKVVLYPFF